MKQQTTEARKGVQSVEIGLALFKQLALAAEPIALSELARAADMHRAKVHRYLASLIRAGFARQDAQSGLYALGPFAEEFAAMHFPRQSPLQLAMPVAEQLARESGETCLIAMWGNSGPTVIRWYRAPRSVALSVVEGTVFSLTLSASGRLFAAYMPEIEIASRLKLELSHNRAAKHPQAPRNLAQMAEIFRQIRHHGLSRVYGLHERGIDALAAPVFSRDGKLALCLTLLGAETTFDATYQGMPAACLRQAADKLSAQLGFTRG